MCGQINIQVAATRRKPQFGTQSLEDVGSTEAPRFHRLRGSEAPSRIRKEGRAFSVMPRGSDAFLNSVSPLYFMGRLAVQYLFNICCRDTVRLPKEIYQVWSLPQID
jgi:hypothetical protein